MNGKTEEDAFYQTVFQNSRIGQVILSEDLSLIAANDRMFEHFQLKPGEVQGKSFGCVFHCAYREKGQICGQNGKCEDCFIKSAVSDIIGSHITITESAMQYQLIIENRHKMKWFQMSGTVIEIKGSQFVLLSFADITELKLQEEDLRKKLALDLATGAMNKHSLMLHLEKLVEPDAPLNEFTLVMIDFDLFRQINNKHGHLKGDKVLEIFSEIARRHIRKKDILGRYGGEEFIFVFPDVDQKQALRILKRIHRELRNHFSKEMTLPVTFSAGIIHVDREDRSLPPVTDLIGEVDRMLYQAKKHGRNRASYDKGEILFERSDRQKQGVL